MEGLVRSAQWWVIYQFLASFYAKTGTTFLNYGCSNTIPVPRLTPNDERDILSIRLCETALGPVRLRGKDVLVVGCGAGSDASYFARYHQPREVLGVDFSHANIRLCLSRWWQVPNLAFRWAMADNLPCGDRSVQVVVNIESSHCYPSQANFFQEVSRVLNAGGYFCWSDLVDAGQADAVREMILRTGMEQVSYRDITAEALASMDVLGPARAETVRKNLPPAFRFLTDPILTFCGVPNTSTYNRLRSRELLYVSYVFQKP